LTEDGFENKDNPHFFGFDDNVDFFAINDLVSNK